MKAPALALLAAFLSSPALARDAVSLDEKVVYYDVRGMTEEAIARSLRRDAPRALDGFQGETTFYFAWEHNYEPAGKRGLAPLCRVTGATVEIDIVITVPRHRTIEKAPDAVGETWRVFAEALERHERHHAEDFARIGAMIPDALNGLVAPCAVVEDAANAKGMEYVDRAQAAADTYDAETNHGETEGTFFPGSSGAW